MGLETQIRQKSKAEKVAGATVAQIIHPLTQDANPSSLLPSTEDILIDILANNFSDVDGSLSSITGKVSYDLAYAQDVYDAFEVNSGQENPQLALGTAIDAYGSSLEIDRDDYELESDVSVDTIKALKLGSVSVVNIQASFNRSSAIRGIVTLETIARELDLSFTGETTDEVLSEQIYDAISLL